MTARQRVLRNIHQAAEASRVAADACRGTYNLKELVDIFHVQIEGDALLWYCLAIGTMRALLQLVLEVPLDPVYRSPELSFPLRPKI